MPCAVLGENPRRVGTYGFRSNEAIVEANGVLSTEAYFNAGGRPKDLNWEIAISETAFLTDKKPTQKEMAETKKKIVTERKETKAAQAAAEATAKEKADQKAKSDKAKADKKAEAKAENRSESRSRRKSRKPITKMEKKVRN